MTYGLSDKSAADFLFIHDRNQTRTLRNQRAPGIGRDVAPVCRARGLALEPSFHSVPSWRGHCTGCGSKLDHYRAGHVTHSKPPAVIEDRNRSSRAWNWFRIITGWISKVVPRLISAFRPAQPVFLEIGRGLTCCHTALVLPIRRRLP